MDLYIRVRAYLRQQGENDMTKFRMKWENGVASIGTWLYLTIHPPTDEDLEGVPYKFLQYENTQPGGTDIYMIPQTTVNSAWKSLVLQPVRLSTVTTHATTVATGTSLAVNPGIYRLTVEGGHTGSNGRISLMSTQETLFTLKIREDNFQTSLIISPETAQYIRLDARGGQLELWGTLVIEKL
jgi:hypothetical protein